MGRRLARIALAVALLLAGLEAASLGWIYAKRGVVYYAAPPAAAGAAQGAAADAETAPDRVFHPYLGFVLRSGQTGDGWRTNNAGFQVAEALARDNAACCDYPLGRQGDELLVGIFGGTVATEFALRAQASDRLARALQAIPAYRDRPVQVLNFAVPEHRQPQPLFALGYFMTRGQALDIAIAIDGFAEVTAGPRSYAAGTEPGFPEDALWGEPGRQLERLGGLTGAAAADAGLAGYYRHAAGRLSAEAPRCALAVCHLGKRALARAARWRAERLERDLRQSTATQFPTTLRSRTPPGYDAYAAAADSWRDASLAMAAIARQRDVLFLHVLQPNPWWREAGPYRPIAADHVYDWVVEPVNRGYGELVARVPGLQAAGVEMLDATRVFADRDPRLVYADDCCRYTGDGHDILATAVAERIDAIQAAPRVPGAPR